MGRQVLGYQPGLVGDSNEVESFGVDNTMPASQPASVNDDLLPLEGLICLDDFPPLDTELFTPPSFSPASLANAESIPSCADFTEGCSFDPDRLASNEGPAPWASDDFLWQTFVLEGHVQ